MCAVLLRFWALVSVLCWTLGTAEVADRWSVGVGQTPSSEVLVQTLCNFTASSPPLPNATCHATRNTECVSSSLAFLTCVNSTASNESVMILSCSNATAHRLPPHVTVMVFPGTSCEGQGKIQRQVVGKCVPVGGGFYLENTCAESFPPHELVSEPFHDAMGLRF